ncbi:MAG: hypothetical protein QOD42_3062 [Sphingomonadales bacterium]|jgi:hypothetical protein|nr:hypothetical protein [Sphingomonadales bacterium]
MVGGKRKPSGKKVRRFIESRRAVYLETLRRTGNHKAAARAAGIDRSAAEQRRKRDADFALACVAAEAEAAQRLAGAQHMFDGVEDARFETVRRGRGGRLQIVATRTGKWNKAMEDDYFDVLRATGNLAAAARAAGVSTSLIWQRRRAWPGFRARLEETLEEAELVLEFRLAAHGTNVGIAPEGAAREARPATVLNGDTLNGDTHLCVPAGTHRCVSPPPPSPPFDPDFTLRFLRWREEKRRGGGQRGRPPPAPDIAAVTERIIRKVEAIKRHRAKSGGPERDSQPDGDQPDGDSQ